MSDGGMTGASSRDVEVSVERLAYGGDAICHLPDGKTAFVPGACPGDRVAIKVTSDRGRFARATITEVIEASRDRVRPACPLAGACGGCSWQHISYGAQTAAKQTAVADALTRIGGFPASELDRVLHDIVESPRTLGYRNKMEFEVATGPDGGLSLGMHAAGGDHMRIDSCPLLPSPFSKAPKALRGALRYLQGNCDLKISRAGVRYSPRMDSAEVALWTEPGAFPRARAAKIVGDAVMGADVVRVLLDMHQGKHGKARGSKGSSAGDTSRGKPRGEGGHRSDAPSRDADRLDGGATLLRRAQGVEVLAGPGHWTERLCGMRYAVSAPSFFQVNTEMAEMMVEHVVEWLQASRTDRVADLYSGVGTFTLPLAEKTDHVVAVESEGSSVRDLKRNLTASRLAAEVRGGDVARELPQLGALDLAVIDPPRTGLAPSVAGSLCEARIGKLAYVSCNPTTLARDLKMLCDDVYHLESVTPFDLFPQTYHVETVALMSRV